MLMWPRVLLLLVPLLSTASVHASTLSDHPLPEIPNDLMFVVGKHLVNSHRSRDLFNLAMMSKSVYEVVGPLLATNSDIRQMVKDIGRDIESTLAQSGSAQAALTMPKLLEHLKPLDLLLGHARVRVPVSLDSKSVADGYSQFLSTIPSFEFGKRLRLDRLLDRLRVNPSKLFVKVVCPFLKAMAFGAALVTRSRRDSLNLLAPTWRNAVRRQPKAKSTRHCKVSPGQDPQVLVNSIQENTPFLALSVTVVA